MPLQELVKLLMRWIAVGNILDLNSVRSRLIRCGRKPHRRGAKEDDDQQTHHLIHGMGVRGLAWATCRRGGYVPRVDHCRKRRPVSPAVVDFQSTLNGTRIGAGSVGGVRFLPRSVNMPHVRLPPHRVKPGAPGGCAKIRVTGGARLAGSGLPRAAALERWPLANRASEFAKNPY